MAMVNLIKILQCLTHQQSNRNSIQSKGFQGVSTQNKIRFPTFFVVVFFSIVLQPFCGSFVMISNISKALETTKRAMAPRENLLWILHAVQDLKVLWDSARLEMLLLVYLWD